MKMQVTFVLVFCAAGYCGDITLDRVGMEFVETFSSFGGTLATLPAGWSVSSNGASAMTEEGFCGSSTGGVTSGGCYAWDRGGDKWLGCQPTTAQFTPGWFAAVFSNATGERVREVLIAYDVVFRNDQDRASELAFAFCAEGTQYMDVVEMRFMSPAARDGAPCWQQVTKSCRLAFGVPVEAGGRLILRWWLDDSSGSGSRDEYGIDNIRLLVPACSGTVISIN